VDTRAPSYRSGARLQNLRCGTEQGYARLLELTKAAPKELLDESHGFDPLEPAIMTKGGLMSHLLVTHISFHTAQLSACRQGKGLTAVF